MQKAPRSFGGLFYLPCFGVILRCMQILQEDYNTQRPIMKISEFGRHIQGYIDYIKTLPEKEKRTDAANAVIQIMSTLNPELRLQNNYKEKLWGHLFQIADYDLDVDSPYPIPEPEKRHQKPSEIGYNDSKIKFRFYGRNLQNMVDTAAAMDNSDLRQNLVNLIASFMYNSCKSWNNENLSNETIAEHLKVLSQGKLLLASDEFVVSQDNSPQKKFFNRNNNSNNKNNNNRNKNKFNRPKGGYRRF